MGHRVLLLTSSSLNRISTDPAAWARRLLQAKYVVHIVQAHTDEHCTLGHRSHSKDFVCCSRPADVQLYFACHKMLSLAGKIMLRLDSVRAFGRHVFKHASRMRLCACINAFGIFWHGVGQARGQRV